MHHTLGDYGICSSAFWGYGLCVGFGVTYESVSNKVSLRTGVARSTKPCGFFGQSVLGYLRK